MTFDKSLFLALAVSVTLLTPRVDAAKPLKIKAWMDFGAGWQCTLNGGLVRTTLPKKVVTAIVKRINDLRPFYANHFKTKLKKSWSFTVLANFDQYNRYAKEVTKGRTNVQGQCLRSRREVVVCNSKRYGWLTTLSHEYAHAHYDSSGPIWLREGIASLAEVAEKKGRKFVIPVNPPRLRGLRLYQKKGHYKSVSQLLQGKKETDGYGYSYEHGWSVHYFLYCRNAKKYRAFLVAVRKGRKRDLTSELRKFFGMDLSELDREWSRFMKKLK